MGKISLTRWKAAWRSINDCASSDTAIVRGALIRGLAEKSPRLASVRIDGRVARRHYGTMAYVEFDPEIDEPGRKYVGLLICLS